jgi:hypothetical protein
VQEKYLVGCSLNGLEVIITKENIHKNSLQLLHLLYIGFHKFVNVSTNFISVALHETNPWTNTTIRKALIQSFIITKLPKPYHNRWSAWVHGACCSAVV